MVWRKEEIHILQERYLARETVIFTCFFHFHLVNWRLLYKVINFLPPPGVIFSPVLAPPWGGGGVNKGHYEKVVKVLELYNFKLTKDRRRGRSGGVLD